MKQSGSIIKTQSFKNFLEFLIIPKSSKVIPTNNYFTLRWRPRVRTPETPNIFFLFTLHPSSSL
jgi:hypothetical protein